MTAMLPVTACQCYSAFGKADGWWTQKMARVVVVIVVVIVMKSDMDEKTAVSDFRW